MSTSDLVLLHGMGDTVAVWETLAPYLDKKFNVHTLSAPGHVQGTSVSDPAAMSQALLTDYDALQLDRPVVVGHSLGGVLSLLLMAQRDTAAVIVLDQPLNSHGFMDPEKALENAGKNGVEKTLTEIFLTVNSDSVINKVSALSSTVLMMSRFRCERSAYGAGYNA